MASLVGAGIISAWFVLLWLWLFLDEWIYAVRHKIEKRGGTTPGGQPWYIVMLVVFIAPEEGLVSAILRC